MCSSGQTGSLTWCQLTGPLPLGEQTLPAGWAAPLPRCLGLGYGWVTLLPQLLWEMRATTQMQWHEGPQHQCGQWRGQTGAHHGCW